MKSVGLFRTQKGVDEYSSLVFITDNPQKTMFPSSAATLTVTDCFSKYIFNTFQFSPANPNKYSYSHCRRDQDILKDSTLFATPGLSQCVSCICWKSWKCPLIMNPCSWDQICFQVKNTSCTWSWWSPSQASIAQNDAMWVVAVEKPFFLIRWRKRRPMTVNRHLSTCRIPVY